MFIKNQLLVSFISIVFFAILTTSSISIAKTNKQPESLIGNETSHFSGLQNYTYEKLVSRGQDRSLLSRQNYHSLALMIGYKNKSDLKYFLQTVKIAEKRAELPASSSINIDTAIALFKMGRIKKAHQIANQVFEAESENYKSSPLSEPSSISRFVELKAWKAFYELGLNPKIKPFLKTTLWVDRTWYPQIIKGVLSTGDMPLVKAFMRKFIKLYQNNRKVTDYVLASELKFFATGLEKSEAKQTIQLLKLALDLLPQNSQQKKTKRLHISILSNLATTYDQIGDFTLSRNYAREGLKLNRKYGFKKNKKLTILLSQAQLELQDSGSAAQSRITLLKNSLDAICKPNRKNISLRELPKLPVFELITNDIFAKEFLKNVVVNQYIDCALKAGFKKKSFAVQVEKASMMLIGLKDDHDRATKILDRLINDLISVKDLKNSRNNLNGFNEAALGLILTNKGRWLIPYLPKLRKYYEKFGTDIKDHSWVHYYLRLDFLIVRAYGTSEDNSYFTKLTRSRIDPEFGKKKQICGTNFNAYECGYIYDSIASIFEFNRPLNKVLTGRLLENMGFINIAERFLSQVTDRFGNEVRNQEISLIQSPYELARLSAIARLNLKLKNYTSVKEITVPIIQSLKKVITQGSFGSDEALKWAGRQRGLYKTYMSALGEELLKGKKLNAEDIETAFSITQYLQLTKTAGTFSQLSARIAVQSGGLARQHQDLNRKITKHYDQLLSANNSSAKQISFSIKQLEQKRNKITSQLQKENPDYFEHARMQILSIEETRASLKEGEALISTYMGPKHTFLWWLDNKEIKLQVLNIPSKELKATIKNLRKGLERPDQNAFQMSTSFKLYSLMFSKLESQLDAVKSLVFIPHGVFDSLPLSVLLRKEPEITEYKQNDILKFKPSWLVNSHSVKVLPAISTIKILRKTAQKKLPDSWNYFGVANPNYQNLKSETNGKRNLPRNVGLFPALPETEDEIRKIQKAFPKSEGNHLLVGKKATESELAKINLQAYDVISFATHAVVSNELPGLAEPALILTPISRSDKSRDGILTAREIISLKLNAELVMLSACNTAAGDGTLGAEGLSGLAKAFFYAGSRNLLVTHWAIASEPAVDLAVGLMKKRLNGKAKDWSKALQQSVIDLMNKSERNYLKHPSIWGAHMIVGAN
jgi:CHAT domain-containing protein/tetratricopeptide (TPR) repeat protein